MNRLEKIIQKNLLKHKSFEEYFKMIKVVRDNRDVNPDISIESCKALIEGISKTIIFNLDKSYSIAKIDNYDLPKLFKESIKLLSLNCEDIEGDFVMRFSTIIQVLGEIRNKRGDISHGRMAPKQVNSSSKFASTICYMTESILYYILEHYFALNLELDSGLEYEVMEAYNDWLDESVEFPIEKVKYSKMLFKYDYDSYENRYSDEYLMSEQHEEEIADMQKQSNNLEITLKFHEQKQKPQDLTNDFDPESFWTEERNLLLKEFAINKKLDSEGLKNLVNNYKVSDKTPVRNIIAKIMIEKPSLQETKYVLDDLSIKLIAFADEL